jgi:hypothetical protein
VKLLARAVQRVWEANQGVRSQEDFELGAITLRLLSSLYEHCKGTGNGAQWPEGLITLGYAGAGKVMEPLDSACAAAFGCLFDVWRQRNLERKSKLAWELGDAMEPASGVRRPTEGGRKVYSLSEAKGSRKQEPVPRVPQRTKEAV